jgi:ribosomal protein L12E/L44/L45/RPP1/RPP2
MLGNTQKNINAAAQAKPSAASAAKAASQRTARRKKKERTGEAVMKGAGTLSILCVYTHFAGGKPG